MPLNPHDYATARRYAEHLRQAEQDKFWRRAYASPARSSIQLWATMTRQTRRPITCP
ncbi:hypothetical protein [Hydrogenophaga crassostreae]|uniref:hypothetical protein n=1 Tax=Hydrogenophaga crassostreae TaxID=1763535 RepID=UPI000ACB7990|nr:hypothetical protein [Hydrogenophaga crassostreae]